MSLPALDEYPRPDGVFATTHWSVVLEAQGDSPAAQEALEKLCRAYWLTTLQTSLVTGGSRPLHRPIAK